ncbi:MAG: hypothetical protein JNJ48_04405 [Phycisphaerae bacterium]|nr:hypothetical protein [Phycisphaerae bacterium]
MARTQLHLYRFTLALAAAMAGLPVALASAQPGGPPATSTPSPGSPLRAESVKASFTLGPDWQPMEAQQLSAFNEGARKVKGGSDVMYDAGYMLVNGQGQLAAYMLVQTKAGTIASGDVDDLIAAITRGDVERGAKQVAEQNKDQFTDLALDRPTVDRSTGRIRIPVRASTADGVLRGISYGHIGGEGLLMLHCYTSLEDFDALSPRFEAINASVAFDAGATYSDALGRSGRARGGSGSSVLQYGIIGAIIGGIGALLFRKKPAPAPPAA